MLQKREGREGKRELGGIKLAAAKWAIQYSSANREAGFL